MNRRSVLTFLVTLLGSMGLSKIVKASEASHPGGELDQWASSNPEVIPVRPWKRAVRYVQTCAIRAGHWTIGALSAGAASIGQVRHHLVSVHGHSYGELNGLSKEQLCNIHDADHEGRRVSYRSSYGNSNCPNGMCPTGNSRSGNGGTNIRTKTRTNFFTGLNFF